MLTTTDMNVCRTNVTLCQNEGMCTYNQTAPKRFTCSCPDGYGGKTCQLGKRIVHAVTLHFEHWDNIIINYHAIVLRVMGGMLKVHF